MIIVNGDFSIRESCVSNIPTHFSSVDFNMCYDQLFYYLLGMIIENKLLHILSNWDIKDFLDYQSTNFLTIKLTNNFYKVMNPENFKGTIKINDIDDIIVKKNIN
jgi:hypothetical protein